MSISQPTGAGWLSAAGTGLIDSWEEKMGSAHHKTIVLIITTLIITCSIFAAEFTIIRIGGPGSADTRAFDINNDGMVVGHFVNPQRCL